MGKILGEPFRGELHSTDASSGVILVLYKDGSTDAYTLAANEYLEICSIQIVTDVGGDVFLFTGADATPAAGEYINRGPFAANGGIVQELKPPHAGKVGHGVYIDAPAGDIDVIIRGGIRREGATSRASWKEAGRGG